MFVKIILWCQVIFYFQRLSLLSNMSQARHQDWDPSCKIYIRGLRSDSSKEQLMDTFTCFGRVLAIWVAQKPPGYAFLLMESSSDARESCVALNNTIIGGHRMQVEMATGSVKGGRTSDLEETSNSEKSRLFFGILALLIIGPMCTWGPIIGSPCLFLCHIFETLWRLSMLSMLTP